MQAHIALLRGINVGGHKKIKMADLKLLFEELSFVKVCTYIQSGNLVFSSNIENRLGQIISEAILSRFGFEVPILIKTVSEIEEILATCPFSEERKTASYFTMFSQAPSRDLMAEINTLSYPNEKIVLTESCAYFYSEKSYSDAKCNNNFFEKKLKVVATTRNYRTLAKLLELANQV